VRTLALLCSIREESPPSSARRTAPSSSPRPCKALARILYRLWNTSSARAVRRALADHRSTSHPQSQRALTGSFEFRESLLTTLRRTWYAARRSEERITNGDLEIWRYPPLVSEALRRLHFGVSPLPNAPPLLVRGAAYWSSMKVSL
jgi:hypothetical protein